MRKLLQMAERRSAELLLGDETLICHEMTGPENMRFSNMLKEDRTGAFCWMMEQFVKTPAGEPAFTQAEAKTITEGSPRVFLPIFTKITGFLADEKKALPPTNSSITDSPSPSGEPAKS